MRIGFVYSDIIQIVNRSHSDLQNLDVDDHSQYALRTIMTADGDMIYRSGGAWIRLAKAAAGKVLISGDAPSWGLPVDLAISGQAQGDIIYCNGTNWVRLAAGTSGQYLKTQGSAANPVWSTFIASPSIFVASDDLLASADTEEYTDSLTYELKKAITIPGGGTIRVKFDLRIQNSDNAAYGRVYHNGVAIGTEQVCTSMEYVTYSEDISGFYPGDSVQLYVHRQSETPPASAFCRNFRFYGAVTTDFTVTNQ